MIQTYLISIVLSFFFTWMLRISVGKEEFNFEFSSIGLSILILCPLINTIWTILVCLGFLCKALSKLLKRLFDLEN